MKKQLKENGKKKQDDIESQEAIKQKLKSCKRRSPLEEVKSKDTPTKEEY